MISKFTVAKVFTDKAISAVGSTKFVANGESYTPSVDTAYIKEAMLYGADESIGTASTDGDIARGVYVLTLYVPRINKGSKWQGLSLIDDLRSQFPKFSRLNDAPLIMTRETFVQEMKTGQTHNSYDLDIRFTVIG
jgi:hypothetical protein